jgi:hypothetical protein
MADIFISYAREDEDRIRGLVLALEKHGWSIFWDQRIPAGKTWDTYIGQALSEAKCVIVAWSKYSITSGWVKEEANDAKERGVLVPVSLEPVKAPLGFRGIQAADLTDWKPGHASPNFDKLIEDITGVIGGKPPRPSSDELVTPRAEPVATPRVISTEPPPREPESPGNKTPNLLIGAVIAVAIAIVVGWALWSSRETRLVETRPVETPVIKVPEGPPKGKEGSESGVKPTGPKALQPEPAAKAPNQRTFDQATARFGVTLGWQLARYEFIHDSTILEARNASLAAKRDIKIMLSQDKFPYEVDSLDLQQLFSTVLLYYGASNPAKHSTILLGIAAMRASLIGSSSNQKNNEQLRKLAYSAIQDIDSSIIGRKQELFEQLLETRPNNVTAVLELLNKMK